MSGSRGSAGTVVRSAAPGDAPALADVLMEALGTKYRPAFGPRARAALERLIADELRAGGDGYLVAEGPDGVVGAAHLSLAEDPPSDGVTRRLAQTVGRPRAAWAVLVLSLLAHGPLAPDEAYVGELGVAAHARRAGVATGLLREMEARAAARGKTRMTLWVTTENAAARTLYARHGFREVRRRRWLVGGPLFGSRGALLMEKVLAP